MAIDTRYVAIVPKFDTRAFTRIKKQIEGIGKGLSAIPVGYKFNSKSLSGLKTKINSELKSGKFGVNIPVNYNFTKSNLSGLKGEINSTIKASSFKAEIPIKFSLRGARKELQEQLKGFSFKPVIIPARIQLTGEGMADIKKKVDIISGRASSSGSSNDGSGRGSGSGYGGQSTLSATKDIARYGVGFAILNELSRIITSPVGLESRLNSIVATINNDRKSQNLPELTSNQIDKLRSEIVDIASDLPTTILEVADAAKSLAKAGISFDQIVGGATRETARAGVAGEESLASTADFTARMLEVFEKDFKGEINQGDAFKNISKILIGTIETTLFDLVDVQQAFKQGASGARAAGLSGAEFGALLASVSAMSTGSDVGTSIKTFLRFLTVPKSKDAEAAFDELGLDPFDSKGKIKNIREIIKLMEELNKSTDEDRLRLISDIFGQDASRVADLLSFKGLDEFLKAFAAIENTDVDKILSTKLQGVEAQFILMRASLEKLYVNLFDPTSLKDTASIISDISSNISDTADYVKAIGGISGVWDEFMSSEFMIYLNSIKDVLKTIMSVFGIDIDRKIAEAQRGVLSNRYSALSDRVNKDPLLQNPAIRNELLDSLGINKLNSNLQPLMPNKESSFDKFMDSNFMHFMNPFKSPEERLSYMFNQPASNVSGNTIYVTPPADGSPQEYGEAVVGALSLRSGTNRMDDILSSGMGILAP